MFFKNITKKMKVIHEFVYEPSFFMVIFFYLTFLNETQSLNKLKDKMVSRKNKL